MVNIISQIINSLKGVVSKELIVFIISLMPLLELRGGLIAAAILNVEYLKAGILCIIGNIIPIPFILLFLKKVFSVMERFKPTKKVVVWLEDKAKKNKPKIDKYGVWGLVLFVGIPLPGTGAWTGSLVASVFEMDYKKSLLAIFLGIILAFIIMSIVSYGVIGNIIR
ncbi:MAG: small multi-drug export protein [Lachnospiraceae bacterium]|nr:small multi-drug export protein [Lachnospiraceae bacterium]